MKTRTNGTAPKARNEPACLNASNAMPLATTLRTSKGHYETADNYVGVIAQLDDRHRVIICKDALQWILQVRRGQRGRQAEWKGKSYLTTPDAVIRVSDALCGPLARDVLIKLQALPSKPGVKQ
jgi:hypothetical protein